MFPLINPAIKKCFIILAWAGFTFASHYYAKVFLAGSNNFAKDVLILTSVQLLLASQLLNGNREVRYIITICSEK